MRTGSLKADKRIFAGDLAAKELESDFICIPTARDTFPMIPNPDLPGAIPATRNLSLENTEAETMIVHLNRQLANPWGMGEGFPQYPALEHPIFFEAEVILMCSNEMFLDDKPGIIYCSSHTILIGALPSCF